MRTEREAHNAVSGERIGARARRRSPTATKLATASALIAIAACDAGAPSAESPGSNVAQAIAGGDNDANSAAANVVVRLGNPPVGSTCSGTLITPTMVLTAAHCVNGAYESDGSFTPGLPLPIGVYVGNTASGPLGKYTVSNSLRIKAASAYLDCSPSRTSSACTVGTDLALLELDDGQYVIDSQYNPIQQQAQYQYPQPYIVHPTLIGPDSSMSIGQSGWSPLDNSAYRQVAFDSNANTSHDDDDPGGGWNSWEHDQGSIHTDKGDSGGPLFVLRTDAYGKTYRDVFGVLSGSHGLVIGSTKDEYADITNQSPAGNQWLLSQLVDTTRTAKWMAKHPGYSWIGDVEYGGNCDSANDADCDHWTDAHDNCPRTYNPDQKDSADSGNGDACTPIVHLVDPATGPASGGTRVVITGENLTSIDVRFGVVPAAQLTCNSSTECIAWSPALPLSDYGHPQVDVHVVSIDGVWSAAAPPLDVFTYVPGMPGCNASISGCNQYEDFVTVACAPNLEPLSLQYKLGDGSYSTYQTNNLIGSDIYFTAGASFGSTAKFRVCTAAGPPLCSPDMSVTTDPSCAPPPPPPPKCATGKHYCDGMGCVPLSTYCQ